MGILLNQGKAGKPPPELWEVLSIQDTIIFLRFVLVCSHNDNLSQGINDDNDGVSVVGDWNQWRQTLRRPMVQWPPTRHVQRPVTVVPPCLLTPMTCDVTGTVAALGNLAQSRLLHMQNLV